MKSVDSSCFEMPFGGITVVLGGDLRQILHVIPQASRPEIVDAYITRSRLWRLATVFQLKQNMRINKGQTEEETKELSDFAKWVLDVGDGKIKLHEHLRDGHMEDDICIPERFCNPALDNSVDEMLRTTSPKFLENFQNPNYLSERSILTPTNLTVGHVNSVIVEKIPGEMSSYFSVDSAEYFPGTVLEQTAHFPLEYLGAINIPGLPLHQLKLKVRVVVMLMRNSNQTLGLCNGTRMMIIMVFKHCVQCEVISGAFKETRHFIPRMELSPTETKLPFKMCRKQMPLQICYAMTVTNLRVIP